MKLDKGQPAANRHHPFVVSFSGIDGAGKTTQIELLISTLQEQGLRVLLVRFWDDVAALRKLRECTGHALFRGEKGIGAPGKPVRRRDKNIQSWYMLPIRLCLCLFDALNLSLKSRGLTRKTALDVAIFDRYLYDQAANLPITNPFLHAYIRLLLRLVPMPDRSFLLDADPALACARKPEYPLEFARRNREAYLELAKLAGLRVIPPGTPIEVGNRIQEQLADISRAVRERPQVLSCT